MLGGGDRPTRLLQRVRGLRLVDLPGAEECCGFGGTFALKNSEVSTAMLIDKCAAVTGTGAQFVAAVDNSCLAHIGGGLSRQSSETRTIHYAEILASICPTTPNLSRERPCRRKDRSQPLPRRQTDRSPP